MVVIARSAQAGCVIVFTHTWCMTEARGRGGWLWGSLLTFVLNLVSSCFFFEFLCSCSFFFSIGVVYVNTGSIMSQWVLDI